MSSSAAGNTRAVDLGLDAHAPRGHHSPGGNAADGESTEIEITAFAGGSHHIMGSKMGSTRLSVDIPKLIRHYESGRLKLDELVSRHYRLEEINERLRA